MPESVTATTAQKEGESVKAQAHKPPDAQGIIRFFYLNAYAFLLFALSAAAFLIPPAVLLLIFKYGIVLFLLAVSITMLSGWKNKRRIMAVMLGRNKKTFRPETFRRHTKTFCGRLMVRAVIKDLAAGEPGTDAAEWKARRKDLLSCKKFWRCR
jgi:hypothetical protein